MSALVETLGRRASDQVETIAVLRRQVDELRAELAAAIDANTTARIERDGLGRTLARRSYELAALRAELDALQGSLTDALSRLTRAGTASASLREQLQDAHRENDQLRSQLAAARAVIDQQDGEIMELERVAADRAAAQAGAARALRWQLAALERERAAARRQFDATTAEREDRIGQLDRQIEELHGQMKELDGQIGALEEQGRQLSDERDRTIETMHDRDHSIDSLHDQLREETAIAESLSAQLDRVERRLAVRATQLQAIRQSRSFRIALRLSNFKDAVLHPRRSRQRRRASQAADETENESE